MILSKEQVAVIATRAGKAIPGPLAYRRDTCNDRNDRIVEVRHTCENAEKCYEVEASSTCLGGHVVLREDATPHWANRLHDEANWEFFAAARTDVPELCVSHEILRQKLENMKMWGLAANQFAWAHDWSCPRHDADAPCNCGLDSFLSRPRPFVESYKSRIEKALEALRSIALNHAEPARDAVIRAIAALSE